MLITRHDGEQIRAFGLAGLVAKIMFNRITNLGQMLDTMLQEQ